jgi:hypothetical protein
MMSTDENEAEEYGETGLYTFDKKVPWWLKLSYFVFPIWGFIWFYLFWNGATGWIDRGHWNELEKAANTTFPISNYQDPDQRS